MRPSPGQNPSLTGLWWRLISPGRFWGEMCCCLTCDTIGALEDERLADLRPQVSDIEGGEPTCRPGSVRPLARGGGHPSGTAVAGSLVRSTREHRAGRPRSLAQGAAGSPLDLAPGGVYRAAAVTCGAGGLLHHRFTLTPADAGAVCFLWHCPAGHPGSALPTTLPCGARTFLTGLAPGATARPTHPCSGYAWRLVVDSSSPNP